MVDIDILKRAVVEMEDEQVLALVDLALKNGVPPRDILERGLIAGMKEVGDRFKRKEYYVPEVLLASEAFYAGFNVIQPLLKGETISCRGKVVIGVVRGDIHDIGKNIVRVLVEAAGFHVIDLGKDVPLQKFVDAVRIEKPDILALSSLMSTTMTEMERTIAALIDQGLRNKVKVVIGGAPVTREYAVRIGADAYGEDAADAVTIIEDLIE